MFDILQNFEQAAAGFAPLTLIAPGLVLVIIGLFIWLSGLCFRRPLFVLVGGIGGGFCGYFLSSRNITVAAVSAGLSALVVIILERLFISMLLTALAVIALFIILARPYIKATDPATTSSPDKMVDKTQTTLTLRQSIEAVEEFVSDFTGRVKKTCLQMPMHRWAIMVAVVIVFVMASFWLRHLASAMCCAALGTTLIFAGMILLLLYKGSAPITRIIDRGSFYAAVFAVMVAFGTFEQLILCRRTEKAATKGNRESKDRQVPEQTKRSWCT